MKTDTAISYKEVFQLAESKGYKNNLISPARRVWGDGAPSHKEVDEAANLCELTLIQKWLREKEQININIKFSPQIATNWYATVVHNFASLRPKVKDFFNFNSYESALLHGINEALKLI